MACGIALTFAVAAFTSFGLFALSIAQTYFQNVAQDMLFMYEPPLSIVIVSKLIEALLFIVKGFQAPQVFEALAYNIYIENSIFLTWLFSVLVYGILVTLFASWIFKKKELSILEV